jgi:hypothetical protein
VTDQQVSEETRNNPLVQAMAGPLQGMLESEGTGLSIGKLWDCSAEDFTGLLMVASGPEYQQRAVELAPWGFGLGARGPNSGFLFHLFVCDSSEGASELLALLQRDTALTVAAMGERFGVEFPPPAPYTFNARPAEGEGEPMPIASGYDWDTNPDAEGCLESRSAQGVFACGRILVRAAAMDNVGRPAIGNLWMSLLPVLMQAQG